MSKSTGHWVCRLEGHPDVSTDDLTLDELDVAERACGIPYTQMDPHSSARVAKALLVVMLLRAKRDAGTPQAQAEAEALEAGGRLPAAVLHGAFTFVPPETPKAKLRQVFSATEPASPPPSAPTSVAG